MVSVITLFICLSVFFMYFIYLVSYLFCNVLYVLFFAGFSSRESNETFSLSRNKKKSETIQWKKLRNCDVRGGN